MCEPASFVVTKTKVFWSTKSEHHSHIIAEHKLLEKDVRGNFRVACVEITPPNGDLTLPFCKWVYHLDSRSPQDVMPIWYDAKDVERRCRAKLKEWRAAKVVMPNEKRVIRDGQIVGVYGKVKASGSAIVRALNSAVVYALGSAIVKAFDSAKVEAYDSAIVEATDSAVVKAFDSAIVEAYGSATIIAYNLLSPDILRSPQSVLINRSNKAVVCHIGKP